MTLANVALLLLLPLTFVVNSISIRFYQVKIPDASRGMRAFQGAFCLLGALLYALAARSMPSISAIILGMAFGVCFFLTLTCSAICYEIGPMSLTAILVNASLIWPVLWSICFWEDMISARMLAGMILICLTFALSSLGMHSQKNRMGKRWLLLAMIAFCCNGGSAVLQKSYQRFEPQGEGPCFLLVAYLTAALLFFGDYVLHRRQDAFLPRKRRGVYLLLVSAAGAGSFAGNFLLQSLCARIPAGVLYPVANGGLCVVTALASFLLFHERPTRWKICSIVSGVAGIAVLAL